MKKRLLEFIGKTRATFDSITPLAEKRGQKESVPAVDLGLIVKCSNDKLNMLSPELRTFLFEKTGKGPKDLVGVEPVSDLPNLTPAAIAIGAVPWEYEQTGCTLTVYQGTSHDKHEKCVVKKVKITPQEGGSVEISFHVYISDVDQDTMGFLGLLKAQERDIELEAPEVAKPDLVDKAQEPELTPEKALAKALDQHANGEEVTVKPPAKKKAPLSAKVAGASRKAAAKQSGGSSSRKGARR